MFPKSNKHKISLNKRQISDIMNRLKGDEGINNFAKLFLRI